MDNLEAVKVLVAVLVTVPRVLGQQYRRFLPVETSFTPTGQARHKCAPNTCLFHVTSLDSAVGSSLFAKVVTASRPFAVTVRVANLVLVTGGAQQHELSL